MDHSEDSPRITRKKAQGRKARPAAKDDPSAVKRSRVQSGLSKKRAGENDHLTEEGAGAPPSSQPLEPEVIPKPGQLEEALMSDSKDMTVLANGVKIAGEAFVLPGTSLLLDGRIGAGAVHAVGGLLAKAAFGPIGWILVAANAYTMSVTDDNLTQLVKREPKPVEPAAGA